jgi:hypothetical protein
VTRQQAMKILPDLFRKMGTGMSIDSVASATAFIDWLYKHDFAILSRKERKTEKPEQAK